MPADTSSERALIALNRFGMGGRSGDLARIRDDPRGALLDELRLPAAAELSARNLLTSQQALIQLAAYRRQVDTARLETERLKTRQAMTPYVLPPNLSTFGPSPEGNVYVNEIAARLGRYRDVSIGFIERLVLFWSNHFSISTKDGTIRMVAGAFEREAIRPHVLGRFADMAKAAAQHPAMLLYLDNTRSAGLGSLTGLRDTRRGLNENLAREMLELHTLGVEGGYTQADVTALANILTGWTIASADADATNGGRFTFAPADHEPGTQMLLGHEFTEGGLEQGQAVIEFLATHPATAQHVARKLAVHFVTDNPPEPLVERLAARFRDTDGDLREVSGTLIASDEAWSAPHAKLRSPQEFLIAAARLTGCPDEAKMAISHLDTMGQPFWGADAPKGYPDDTDAWLSPTGINMRLEVADQISRLTLADKPLELAEAAFGDAISRGTYESMRRAATKNQSIALLLMSREFQRR